MSGGTRCNVTHREVSERDYHGGSAHFVARVLRAFPVERTLAWFDELGVELKLEETGKYFPVTDDANTVLEALLARARAVSVEIQAGARVVRLERMEHGPSSGDDRERATGEGMAEAPTPPPGYRLGIQTVKSAAAFDAGAARPGAVEWPLPPIEPDRWLEGDRVVIAAGGLSFPRTGSDGTGYALALSLGHTL